MNEETIQNVSAHETIQSNERKMKNEQMENVPIIVFNKTFESGLCAFVIFHFPHFDKKKAFRRLFIHFMHFLVDKVMT